jgi:hypothetical protein
MNKKLINPILITLCFFLNGCATLGPQFHVEIDSLASKQKQTYKTYILLPGNKDVSPNDLQYQEYSQYINKALTSKGYILTGNIEEADLAVFLGYGIGDPQEHIYSYSIPTFDQTGVSSASTYGTVNDYGSFGSVSATTTYTPSYGVTGYVPQVGSYVTYFRYILLTAFDLNEFRKSKEEIQVWKTTITSTGSSSDLRMVFPILVGAAKDYIGSSTGKQVKVILNETDKRVLEIKE